MAEPVFFDRESSWIEFNARVLAEAMDSDNPPFEQLKFLGIVSSNFDEFFMVRVASLDEDDAATADVYLRAHRVADHGSEYFVNRLYPVLEKEGLKRVVPAGLTDRQRDFIRTHFSKEILPLLTPIAIREEQPLPILVNQSLYLALRLTPADKQTDGHLAVVEVPRNLPRLLSLPNDGAGYPFILIEDVIAHYATELFTGYRVTETGLLRITRGAELSLDEEKDADFAQIMSDALRARRMGQILRVEIASPENLEKSLIHKLDVAPHQVYRCRGWMDYKSVAELANQPFLPQLKRPDWKPVAVREFDEPSEIWNVLRERDLMVHHPYESFDAVTRFLDAAASDPDVLAIKMTLYRAGSTSAVISALEKAAENGKQVTVLVEIKARFDEERNIRWSKRLLDAGATVLYGIAGLKTHAKACLVIRREPEGVRRYAHLSTGNYNEKTARLYSDIGIFTSDEALTQDLTALFNVISGYSQPVGFRKIQMAPFHLRESLRRLIQREILKSTTERPGQIWAKMNSLVDESLIQELYKASQAGVRIKLNVRGICCLVPGVPGLSDNIEVTSIVDMFLEHGRIFYFANGGDEEVYLSSADWMPRNLDRRIEVMFPIENPVLRKAIAELLKLYLKDNVKAWKLLPDGRYSKSSSTRPFRVQQYLCDVVSAAEEGSGSAALRELKPQKPKSSESLKAS